MIFPKNLQTIDARLTALYLSAISFILLRKTEGMCASFQSLDNSLSFQVFF